MTRHPLLALALGALVLAGLILIPLGLGRYGLYVMSLWAVMTIAAMGLNLTLGYAGQISLAQGAFVGIGAYAAAILTTAGLPYVIALIVAILLCFAVGWLLGYPALRVQHHYLAFVTLAFSTLAFLIFRNEEWLTGGIYGISAIPRPNLVGLATSRPLPFYYLCLATLLIVSVALWWLIRSPWGRAFMALRENPLRALSLGVDTRRYTLMAFAIGSSLGGVAGVLYAPLTQFIDPTPFTLALSLNLLMMVIVGGSGFFFGPWLGALTVVLLPEWLRSLGGGIDLIEPFIGSFLASHLALWLHFAEENYLIVFAVAVIALLAYSPAGILGIIERGIARRRTKTASALRAAAKPKLEAMP